MSNFLLIAGAVLVAFQVFLVIVHPSPVTIGGLVFTAGMCALNYSAWKAQR